MNPLNDTDKATNIRGFFVAKLKNLKLFNRTKIDYSERLGSEIEYMRKYFKEYLSVKDCETQDNFIQFNLNHPRYLEIIESKNFE